MCVCVCVSVCVCVCVCVCLCLHSSNIIKWWWDGRHVSLGDGKQLFNFTLPLALSSYTLFTFPLPYSPPTHTHPHPPPYLSKPYVLLSRLNIQWSLSDRSLLGLSKAIGWHTNTLSHTHTHTHTHTHQYSLFWPRPLGWVNISIIYHNSPYNTVRPPSRGIESCRRSNNSDEFLLLGSAFFH